MNIPFTLTSIGGIITAIVLFIILKKVVGLVLRIVLAAVLILAVVIGAWYWTRSDGSSTPNENTSRPQRTPRPQKPR
jgi:hypothetical protein